MKRKITVGIQGGKGSFNEEALLLNWHRKERFEIKYLYTTEKVLEEIENGNIDLGQFAIVNSLSGLVKETIDVIGDFKFVVRDNYSIEIEQCLMMREDCNFKDIKMIMSHPQCFSQCKNNLKKKYPKLKLVVGNGKQIDHAYLAKQLSENEIDKNIAIIGSKTLAKIYNLKILERNLQDRDDNYTTFLLVSNGIE